MAGVCGLVLACDGDDASDGSTTGESTDEYEPVDCSGALAFADPDLEEAVRVTIGVPTGGIRVGDVDSLRTLHAFAAGVSDLSGIECLHALTGLVLTGNEISDLRPLAGLSSLTLLFLESNRVSDLSPLAGLTALTDVWLADNNTSDLSPLSELTELTVLSAPFNSVSDLDPLSELTALTMLDLATNSVSDLSPLSELTELRTLVLDGNRITDLSPLVANTGLSSGDDVVLTDNPIDCVDQAENVAALRDRGVDLQIDCP
jgi:hypothetical protein